MVCLSYLGVPSTVGTANRQMGGFWQGQASNHSPGLLVEVNIEVLVQLFNFLSLHPLLRICELADSAIDVELSRPQISSVLISMCSPDIRNAGPYSSVPSSWLGFPLFTSRTHQPCFSKRSLKSSKAASCFKVRWLRVPVRGSVVEEVLVGVGATL